MFKLIASNPFPDNQNRLFGQTRWRLATWYGGIMGAILSLCGLALYHAVSYAHHLTIKQELELVANSLHEMLEPILQQPGQLAPATQEVLPNLCLINTECLEVTEKTKHTVLQHHRYYDIRLLDSGGNLIAVAGRQPQDLLSDDSNNNYYQQVSLMLHTKDFQDWGYVQVGSNFPEYKLYLARLRIIFLGGLFILIIILIVMSWWLAGRAMEPVRQSYQVLQQFTADAAHELRTPLAAIRATVESNLMTLKIKDIQARETLKIIGRQNLRLSNLVADLLMLCRMDGQLSYTNSTGITLETVSLANLIQDIAEDFTSLAMKSQIQLLTNILVSDPLTIIGNYEQLYRMISNLVANAIQYTPAKGQVKLILAPYVKYALLKIQDTGIGIPNNDLNKVFERFYRVKSDRARHTGGSGLGLSIAQAIAHAHQGKIQVESKLGKGSTFTIFLPVNS
ncbi:MAG: HAMP domain-containing sensor histidine kinase [Xenococcaceae cyanobacterium MO_167.B52]|nr:HAMP domain-containing sensor histidine kinase [Xenococcaceae cyanobacterium MO_167.B52]